MTPSYLPYEPRQQQLLPSALQDWLPEGHPAYYINDVIDSLDLSAFHARYMDGGPRKIARKLHEDVAFRVLRVGNCHQAMSDERMQRTEVNLKVQENFTDP